MPSSTAQPRPFQYCLLAIVGGLTLLHDAALVLEHGFGFDYVMSFSAFVDLDNERNLPTFVAVLMILLGVTVSLYRLVKRLSGLRITPASQPHAASATIRATSPA